MLITKADGTQEEFNPAKLLSSLRRSGAGKKESEEIVDHVSAELHEGDRTNDIYKHAFSLLKSHDSTKATARYSLRRALFGLGPTGFPFESFLARMFEKEGYETKTGIEIRGNCAVHELDVAAYRSDHSFVVEAKFHSSPAIKTDLQVMLYSYARILDLQERKVCGDDVCGIKDLWIITNTKFTTAAEAYGQCIGLSMLSWNYPKGNTLHDRIQESGLYPVTVLPDLSMANKKALLQKDIIVVEDLLKQKEVLNELGLSKKKRSLVLEAASELIKDGVA